MLLFPYSGLPTTSPERNTELLTKLAPAEFQAACVRNGGVNWYGKPNFRLVIMRSRFELVGGFFETNGRYGEAFIPKYDEVPAYEDCFLLEVWRPASWYGRQGYGSDRLVEWTVAGKSFPNLQPIPWRGGYEAVWWAPNIPRYFPVRDHLITWKGQPTIEHRVNEFDIKVAIAAFRHRLDFEAAEIREQKESDAALVENKAADEYADGVAEKLTLFDGIAGTAMRGQKPVGTRLEI